MSQIRIGIVISTTRENRFADKPTQWLLKQIENHPELSAELLDLRAFPMPFFDEQTAPAYAPPRCEAARRWAARIAKMDGFIFVTAEYNRSIPAVLKNALDYAYQEFNRKPAAFLGYGGVGAARAIEQLRLICIELQLAPLRNAVHIAMEQYLAVLNAERQIEDFHFLNTSALSMLRDLSWWARALHVARNDGATSVPDAG
ncbi:NAD(P)H-dependent oxidoreductase [Mesorhizobium sp. BAC0120]|uniref:NADPH-dependent FMN reductase n=1 Tax=Mesorhizobium sp. BAC0120 TaxID=3090670 RepID=UPI00298CBE65|nr:NAD(P)H-dependent oxidoreductase [Mesorhizobium sp. BAC0120]MDW6023337.1 NAD(P)H-dependent oxidoreductase [Mesorhizobium sp. BAC0120]